MASPRNDTSNSVEVVTLPNNIVLQPVIIPNRSATNPSASSTPITSPSNRQRSKSESGTPISLNSTHTLNTAMGFTGNRDHGVVVFANHAHNKLTSEDYGFTNHILPLDLANDKKAARDHLIAFIQKSLISANRFVNLFTEINLGYSRLDCDTCTALKNQINATLLADGRRLQFFDKSNDLELDKLLLDQQSLEVSQQIVPVKVFYRGSGGSISEELFQQIKQTDPEILLLNRDQALNSSCYGLSELRVMRMLSVVRRKSSTPSGSATPSASPEVVGSQSAPIFSPNEAMSLTFPSPDPMRTAIASSPAIASALPSSIGEFSNTNEFVNVTLTAIPPLVRKKSMLNLNQISEGIELKTPSPTLSTPEETANERRLTGLPLNANRLQFMHHASSSTDNSVDISAAELTGLSIQQ
jgi:hypothetical protein